MVQRGGRDQLVDLLLIGWWWGKWESASSTFWFQPVWGLVLVGNIPSLVFNFFHLEGGSVSAKRLEDVVVCIPWRATRTLPQGCTMVSLDCCFSLVSHPLPSLINNCLNLPCWNSGKVTEAQWSLFPVIKEMGDTERLLCPGAPQGPAPYQSQGTCSCNFLLVLLPPHSLPFSWIIPGRRKVCCDVCVHPRLIAALFTVAKRWKQPRCPSTDKWIKLWYIQWNII